MTILITGATSGIGLSIAELFSGKGFFLVLLGRDQNRLDSLSHNHSFSKHITYCLDLSKIENIQNVFDDLKAKGIKLDGLVHCAGMEGSLSPVRSVKQSSLDLLMRLHYEAFVEICKQFYNRDVSNDNGSIVVISSLAAIMCQKNSVDYSASKAAVNASVRVMSKEFQKRGIRVNGVMPANVDTPMCKKLKDFADIEAFQPMGLIEPIQISYLVDFLMSEKAKFITGALIPVSAGMDF